MTEVAEQSARFEGYDIIGDVHGCAQTLEVLLTCMGYSKVKGVYCHRRRQAIFVGDIVDRGPRIREALYIVHDMVEAGHAQIVMGNHEYNAIGYMTKARPGSGREYLREHDERHTCLISETLEQFANHSEDWREFVQWFEGIPLFLEMPEFRVVHACWDDVLIDEFKQRYDSNTLDLDFIHESADRYSFAGRVMDRLTRGTDMALPEGVSMTSADGYIRKFFRTRFWGKRADTYQDIVFQPDALPKDVANKAITERDRKRIVRYGADERPLFFGHYWLDGVPEPISHNLACLDYSAVKYGRLTAYRMDGEQRLSKDKFEWAYVDPVSFKNKKG